MTPQDASHATHRMFEGYLTTQGVPWKEIPVGQSRTADYRLSPASADIICEVKTRIGKLRPTSGSYDPCKPIVKMIGKSRGQLGGEQDFPHCVVLNSRSVLDYLDPAIVASAAFGPGFHTYRPDYSVIDGSPPALRFFRQSQLPSHLRHLANAALSRACNTRISALVILAAYALSDRHLAVWRQLQERQRVGEVIPPGENMRVICAQADELLDTYQYQGTVRVIVLENPYARTPLRDDIFRGPFDQRWTLRGGLYGPAWIGSTLETLYEGGVPFQML